MSTRLEKASKMPTLDILDPSLEALTIKPAPIAATTDLSHRQKLSTPEIRTKASKTSALMAKSMALKTTN